MSIARLTHLVATILVGLSAGFFFTYEASVTLGLAEVGDVTYVEAFQAINETVRNPAFGIVFFGSIPAIAVAVAANWKTAPPASRMLMAVALPLYLTGLIVTATGNVPLNDDLAGHHDPAPAIAAQARADFENDWNRFNLIRAVAIGVSFAALAGAGMFVPDRGDERGSATATRQTG